MVDPSPGMASPGILRIGDRRPRLHASVMVAAGAVVAGDVEVAEDASVWPQCVLRGDYGAIRVGARTNIQDATVIHATAELATILGDDVVVGHGARLEGCLVEDGALIGMGAIVLHGARIGRGAVVGAGAVVPPGTEVPPGAMALGVPARVRSADPETAEQRYRQHLAVSATYVENARRWGREAEPAGRD